MRIFLAFLMLIVCGDMAYGAPRRVLPAAISQSANNTKNATISTPPLSHGNNVIKSRNRVAAVKSRSAVRNATPPSPRNSVAPRAAVRGRSTVSARAASQNTATVSAPAALQSLVDVRAANDECLDSYTKCMDNYCNVLDADLGRCSCSGDTTQFAKISDALATANTELQDAVRKISYLGLSADEITSMYTQTAAEGVMGTITDTSKIKSDLNAITNMLVDVKTPSSSATASGDGIPGLLNIDLTANNFDINSILGTIGGTNSSPLLNQRGEQLYKSASARCKSSVLKNCIGADENVVVSRYKTEINRACIAYGNTLQTKNDDARRMIDNAGRVLQMARLKVQSDKDSYDLKACVAALDACMRDDFVCGDDYGRCLDASGRYFVNGELVSGAAESQIMTDIWGAVTPASDGAFIKQHATNTNIASLIQRVGNPITRDGMCSNVLNKCQKQWRDGKSNTYNSMNNVVLAWLGDVIPKIVVRQRTLINDFRTDCVSTVNACMTKQGIPSNVKPRGTQTIIGNFLTSQVGACRATIDACAGVMGMTDKQILAQYIEKNVCSGYNASLDMCDGDSYCGETLNTCMANGLGESLPTDTQPIIGDFLASQVASCGTIINACANADKMTREEFLAQYIEKNVCSGYDASLDMCNGAYCKDAEIECLNSKSQEYYGIRNILALRVGLGINLIRDLYRPLINECAETDKIKTCAAATNQSESAFLSAWINKEARPKQCNPFDPALAGNNVCNTETNVRISNYTERIQQRLIANILSKYWYPFWTTLSDEGGGTYRQIRYTATRRKSVSITISDIINKLGDESAWAALAGYRNMGNNLLFGYKTFAAVKKVSDDVDKNPVYADIPLDIDSTDNTKYLPVVVQGSTSLVDRDDIAATTQTEITGCLCRLAVPYNAGNLCYTHPVVLRYVNLETNEDIVICPEICAFVLYGNVYNDKDFYARVSGNAIIVKGSEVISGASAGEYIQNFLKSAFEGSCSTGVTN